MDRGKLARWTSRLLGLMLLLAFLLMMRAMAAQLEKLAAGRELRDERTPSADSTTREGDVPSDAVW